LGFVFGGTNIFIASIIAGLISLFSDFETAGGAQVDHYKFIEMAGTVGIGNPSLQERLWDLFDTNGDGEVETEELVLNLSQLLRGDVQDVSRFCYQDF
jgi:Ca2+-binding EF-hand superfamily protein